jgi:PHD/YefM family antitoxin component YafN of YafNO toxin-antitoxin module
MKKTSKKMSASRPPIHLGSIRSLTDFQRNAKKAIREMKRTGQPQVLTVKGKAELVVQDAASYQNMLDAIDRAEAMEGIRRGLASFERGEGVPARKAFDQLFKKYGISRPDKPRSHR